MTRSRAIKVFSQCVENLYMVKDQHPQATKEAISSILPNWVETFYRLLLEDPRVALPGNSWEFLAIRLQTYKVCIPSVLEVK
jgi:importin-9